MDQAWLDHETRIQQGEAVDVDDVDVDCENQRLEKQQAVFESIRHWLAPTDDPNSVGRIGPYEVSGLVGSGGMGVVLKARDNSLDRVVAIKILAPHLAALKKSRQRFEREAKAAAAVKHNGIISIYGVAHHMDVPYFVMPYEVGPSLQQRIDRDGKLTIEETLRVASQVADALTAAHQAGLVHRDIKPSNILLAPGTERALLTDFGLAQAAHDQAITMTGLLAGTPAFMSPEQARGESVDSRSDLFSLGSVIFAMLIGRPPVVETSGYSIVRKIGGETMPQLRDFDATIPEWLNQLVSRLHHGQPDMRGDTTGSVAQTLHGCLAHVQNPKENKLPDILETRTKIPRFKMAVGLIATGAVLALAMLAFQMAWESSGNDRFNPIGSEFDHSDGTSAHDNNNNSSASESPGGNEANDGSMLEWDDGLKDELKEIRSRFEALENDLTELAG